MKTTTIQILPNTEYGVPSGNYDGSSLSFDSPDRRAANYYGGFGNMQTIAFYLGAFKGRIQIQATLDTTPTDSSWFLISDVDATSTALTSNFSRNITGNFTWIRALVSDFEAGTIEKVMMSY